MYIASQSRGSLRLWMEQHLSLEGKYVYHHIKTFFLLGVFVSFNEAV
jgi:hypothetical protein